MNTLNIDTSTYCEIEQQLGILTDDGFKKLLHKLKDIAEDRQNACMVECDRLLDIIKLFESLKITRESFYGNTLEIDDYETINQKIYDNRSSVEEIQRWILRGMLTDIAEMIDEGYRYGQEDSNDSKLLKTFLFYLIVLHPSL